MNINTNTNTDINITRTTASSARSSARRRRLRLAGGALAGLVLAVAAPLAASAHVHVSPGAASADVTENLVFSFSHGCENSPTTGLRVDIPEGVTNATPVADANWSIERELTDNGSVSSIVFTAREPIEDGVKATVAVDVRFDAALADSSVAFPVVQTCAEGAMEWTEVADEGENAHDLEWPAPVVAVGAVAPDDAHTGHDHQGDAAASGTDDADTGTGEASGTRDADATAADPVARWLAAGALVAGIIGVAVAALRRRA